MLAADECARTARMRMMRVESTACRGCPLRRLSRGAHVDRHRSSDGNRRAVRFLADEAGVRQFLDIGTGIPAAGNTHEVA